MVVQWILSGRESNLKDQSYRDGGTVYETLARAALDQNFDLQVTYLSRGNHRIRLIRYLEFARYVWKCRALRFQGDITIRDVFTTAFAPFDKKRKNIVILHHIDRERSKSNLFKRILITRFFKKVRLADQVVVVSEYWKKIMEEAGCRNVSIIYNSFELDRFNFTREQISEFMNTYKLNDKPVIYIGNAKHEKGVVETYQALKDLGCLLVTTGKNSLDLPILKLYLSYSDYLKLLNVSTLVITMSKFEEGWCRTAHEALLCGTPVIGSGKGGMGELLEGGNQVVCDDFADLFSAVQDLLSDKERLRDMANEGQNFTCRFSLAYFEETWVNLISSLKHESSLKVSHILWSARIGGIERFVFDLALSQANMEGMQINLLFGRKTGEFLDIFAKMGLDCNYLDLSGGKDVSLLKGIRAFQVFRRSDVLHYHNFNPLLAFWGTMSRKKIIYTEHGNFGFDKEKTVLSRIKFLLTKYFLNHFVDHITFNSQYTQHVAIGLYGLRRVKRSVVYNGTVMPSQNGGYGSIEASLAENVKGKFVIGTSSRFKKLKRIDRLIEAYALFKKEKDSVLLLIGDGEFRNELEALAQKMGISDSTIFSGFKDNVRPYQSAMDICVIPSEKEAFGLVAIEALALGKPSIVFKDGGGLVDIIEGFSPEDVVEDVAGLARRLEYYHSIKDVEDISQEARLAYSRKFDIENTAKEFTVIYN